MLNEEKFALFLFLTLEEELDNLFSSKEAFRRRIEQFPSPPFTFGFHTIDFSTDQYYTLMESIDDLFQDFPILKESFYADDNCFVFMFDLTQVDFIESIIEFSPLKLVRPNIHHD
jgi:hypothetical protein